MTIVFEGREGVQTYVALTLRQGLMLYSKTGMRPNRAWTPTAMLRKATEITGKKYKRGQYLLAAQDLEAWLVKMTGGKL